MQKLQKFTNILLDKKKNCSGNLSDKNGSLHQILAKSINWQDRADPVKLAQSFLNSKDINSEAINYGKVNESVTVAKYDV